ncbi:hypothetical protein HMPREF0005_01794 [Achromobacter xylosoxidans C54]|nr:hypothetical protein HMPREF0005_01794 [Achromobacter xylosoxidans C54]
MGLSDGDAEIGGDYPALPPAVAASASDYVLDPDARASKEQQARALAPEDAPVVGGSTSDIDEYFDSAPIPAAAFDNPVPTYTPATPAAPKPAAPPAVPVPTTKPPFKDDGSL